MTEPKRWAVVGPPVKTRRGLSPQAANARKTHCKRGHELAGENVRDYRYPGGKRQRLCLTCRREADAAHSALALFDTLAEETG